jgi:hypothetical protein
MVCPNCRTASFEDDVFCRQCGADLMEPSTSLVPVDSARSNLPAVFQNAQLPRLAAGVGALAVGVGIELLRRSLLTRMARSAGQVGETLPVLSGVRDILKPQTARSLKLPRGYEVQETVVYMQRVIRRQD